MKLTVSCWSVIALMTNPINESIQKISVLSSNLYILYLRLYQFSWVTFNSILALAQSVNISQ